MSCEYAPPNSALQTAQQRPRVHCSVRQNAKAIYVSIDANHISSANNNCAMCIDFETICRVECEARLFVSTACLLGCKSSVEILKFAIVEQSVSSTRPGELHG